MQGRKRKYTQLNTELWRNAKRDKKAFLKEHCREIEEKSRMGKTRDLFKKNGDIKGIFHACRGTVKDWNGKVLTYMESAMLCLVTPSCLTLCTTMECTLPGSSVHEDSLGKNTGVALPFPRGFSQSSDQVQVPLHCRWTPPAELPGKST